MRSPSPFGDHSGKGDTLLVPHRPVGLGNIRNWQACDETELFVVRVPPRSRPGPGRGRAEVAAMSSPTLSTPVPLHPPASAPRSAIAAGSSAASIARRTPAGLKGKRAATRERLLDACAALVVRDGFDGVTMTAVAEEAGITRQTVYRYFPNARDLVRATMMRGGRRVLDGQLVVFESEGAPADLLVEAVLSALRTVREDPLLTAAWSARDNPQAIVRSIFDPSFAATGVEGLRSIATRLGWSGQDTHEAYEIIARTVLSYLTLPPPEPLDERALRSVLERRMLPALGLPAR